jgi:uncharacterized protein YdeI (YjbR/CyaY-like superfamily)
VPADRARKAPSTRASTPAAEAALLDVGSVAEWEEWLEHNHDTVPEGVWLRLCNKNAPAVPLTYLEAVEVALCYGWIDGQARKHDDVSRVQRFTPRRRRSVWSKINRERIEALQAAGRMRPAGLRAVEAAKADGRWEAAYDPPSTAEVPEDFLAELREHPKALAFFATLDKRNTYPVVHRLQTARTPATRAKRIAEMVAMFERGERFHA